MKTDRNLHNRGGSCSCTSCVYKSETDHPSLRRFIAQGSKIDRLYYGKYIPLRERKLLRRLVRTRAVYDDIRAQLISDSTFSLSTKGDSKPTKSGSAKELDDTEKSSGAILELVNIVDKGALLGNKLSDCCSCCSCSSKINIHETVTNTQRRRRLYAGVQQHAYNRKKGVRFKVKRIKSDPCTCTLKFSGLLRKHSKAILKKIKHPSPVEPFLDLLPMTDDEPKPLRGGIRDIARTSYHNIKQSNIQIKEKFLEGVSKMKESQTKIQDKIQLETKKSLKKLKAVKDNLKAKVKGSVENLKQKSKTKLLCFCPEKEIAFQVKKDSIVKFKDELKRKQLLKDWECDPTCVQDTCIPEECFIKLKQKKSRETDREKRHHKGAKRYETRTQEVKIGKPLNQSHIKIQTRKQIKVSTSKTKKQKPILRAEEKQEVIGQRVSFNIGSTKKDFQKANEKPKVIIKEQLPVDKPKMINVKRSPLPQKINSRPTKKSRKEKRTLDRKSSQHQAVKIGSSFSFNIEFYKNKSDPKLSTVNLRPSSASEQHSGTDYNYKKAANVMKVKRVQRRQKGSQIILTKSFKEKKTGGIALKRCFCTLKLRAKGTKSKIGRSSTEIVKTAERSVMTFNSSTFPCNLHCTHDNLCNVMKCKENNKSSLLPYECEPGVCTPSDCNPYQCIQLIKMRKKKNKNCSIECALPLNRSAFRRTKSTSSFTSKSNKTSKAKYVQSMITNQKLLKSRIENKHLKRASLRTSSSPNAVRIGSTFSFNIEFYKGNPYSTQPTDMKILSVKPKPLPYPKVKLKQSTLQNNASIARKSITTQIYKKQSNAFIGTAFKRCFCTLKLQKKDTTKLRKKKYFAVGTETEESKYLKIDTANKGTKVNYKYSRFLEPFECQPLTCVPGECDPYQCLERIKRRNIHLKEVGLNAKRPEMTSSSCVGPTCSQKSMRAVQIQSKPKSKQRKVLVKTQKQKRNNENKYDSHYSSSFNAKQAVKIGSTFSFNIEFYKNKSNKKIKPTYPREKTIKISTLRKAKDKGIKINRLNVANIDTQVQKTKKHHKSSMVGPLLKRCFCTLNLQKKWKKEASVHKSLAFPPKIYKVNRALVGEIKQNIFLYSAYQMNIVNQKPHLQNDYFNESPLYNKHVYEKNFREQHLSCSSVLSEAKILAPIKLESDFKRRRDTQQSMKQHNLDKTNEPIDQRNRLKNTLENSIKNSNLYTYTSSLQIKESQDTRLRRYFRRCFCTMNLKVENRGISNKLRANELKKINNIKGKNFQRLKPYECEPGVCIPGECDPFECQKIISKRLLKGISKKSGTTYTSKSISSSAGILHPNFKSKKQQHSLGRKSNYSHIYKKLPIVDHRQAVRVGSNFSFNIEFSKNVTSQKDKEVPKYSSDTHIAKPITKSKGTKKKINHVGQSQTFTEIAHKDSSTMPVMRRCFCTLKLQKKGKLHKEYKNRQQMIPFKKPNLVEVKTVSRGQNTIRFKPLKIAQSLKPYECEPNICVPGNCDPYQCLEIMKRKHYKKFKELATDSMLHDTKSVSSETPTSKIKYKTRALNIKSKKTKSKSVIPKRQSEISFEKPLRQTVRVGSSFSFDIEFFKDRSQNQNKYKKNEQTHKLKHLPKLSKNKNITTNYYGDQKILRNKQSQNANVLQTASTLTESFIKRCFCTARFYKAGQLKDVVNPKDHQQLRTKNKKLDSQNVQGLPYYCEPGICVPTQCDPYLCEEILQQKKKSFLKRCFCVLSLRKKKRYIHENNKKDYERLKKVKSQKIMTKEKNLLRTNALLPYECEPNTCVPYQCNPYECEKLIKLRNKNKFYQESGVTTTLPKKNNVASSTDPYKNPRTITQSTIYKENYKKNKTSNINLSDKPKYGQSRQSVKLGSTFSFNIEFTKQKNFDSFKIEKQPKTKVIKSKNLPHSFDATSVKKKTKTRYAQRRSKMYTNQSQAGNQIMKTQSTITELSPPKRCFCTLNLRKPKIEKLEQGKILQSSVSTETNRYKQPVYSVLNLLPYECEPGVCVPGECDPNKCYELIKKRKNHNKNLGTNTKYPQKRNAIVTMTKGNNETKNKKLQYKSLKSGLTKSKLKQWRPKQKYQTESGKQAVRIGSNFSFNIEFYKNNIEKDLNKQHFLRQQIYTQKQREPDGKGENSYRECPSRKERKPSNVKEKKNFKSQALQSHFKKESKSSGIDPFLKRCFCTLKLQKMPANRILKAFSNNKHNSPIKRRSQVITKNKSTTTLKKNMRIQKLSPYECEPFFCIPGECDPYVCAERINMREKETRNTKTQVAKKLSQKNVHVKLENYKTQKNQANFKNPRHIISQPSGIVEVPKFSNMLNKQAVRVGSNFSFNIEFYKDNIPYTNVINYGQKNKINKSKTTFKPDKRIKMIKSRSCGSQGDFTKTEEKFTEAGNVLKRCFCTLELQNKFKKKSSTPHLLKKTQFPQSIEVRRVAVHQKPKMLTKHTHTEVRSVSTKTNNKCFDEHNNFKAKCNSFLCRKGKTGISNDMKTILPYRPTNFNTAGSKTLISPGSNQLPRDTLFLNRSKKLTRKKSNQHIVQPTLIEKKNISSVSPFSLKKILHGFACICKQKTTKSKNVNVIFKNKECKSHTNCYRPYDRPTSQNKTRQNNLKLSKSERQTKPVSKTLISKSKSVKLGYKYDSKKCKDSCPFPLNQKNKYMTNQGGDNVCDYPIMTFKINQKHLNDRQREVLCKEKQTKKSFNTEALNPLQHHIKQKKRDRNLCAHCLKIDMERHKNKLPVSALRVHFLDDKAFNNCQGVRNNVSTKLKKPVHKENGDDIEKLAQLCQYCSSCGKKINKVEFKKAAGDHLDNIFKKIRLPEMLKTKKDDNVCSGEVATKPLFEMRLNSDSYEIINKKEVIDNVINLKTNSTINLSKGQHQNKIHSRSCRCCVCLAKHNKTGAKLTVTAKGSKVSEALVKLFHRKKTKLNIPSGRPCICGSLVCAQKIQKMSKLNKKKIKIKRCVCNSPICDKESAKMRSIYNRPDKVTCICKTELEKKKKQLKKQKVKKDNKKRSLRLKEYKKVDRIRNKKRRKQQKDMEKRINRNASDIVLLAESAIDIGKFGITACADILRIVARTAADPKQAYRTLKTIKANPKLLSLHLKSAYKDSGVAATARRVRLRCLAMKGVNRVRNVLESFAITKYLLYIASKDPKHRLVKKQRFRERFDFGCSLYMASLRKRPFLTIYDRCPWFYPHFLSLVNVWKQFTDIMLFLLAVVVWSPCIICMEVCRAMMCCLFCTG